MLRRSIFNCIYSAVALFALPFVLWRLVRSGKTTPALWSKFSGRVAVREKSSRRIWIHAVSVGEVLQVRPLIRELRGSDPSVEIVLSTTTGSGLKLAREKYSDCVVIPFPFDFSWAVKKAFSRIDPDAVTLVELELWPNFIAEATRRNVPLIVANGRLSEKSYAGYRRFAAITGPMFESLTCACAQNETYQSRFINLGVDRESIAVTGSIKFDGLATDRNRTEVQTLRHAFGITDDDIVLMAGSTHDPEETHVLEAWKTLRTTRPNLRLLVVPRHPERFDSVSAMLQSNGFTVARRSQLSQGTAAPQPEDVFLLDTVGELSACWGLADIAFVGGTLTERGGQNMLEPAAYGCPVLMGPNVWNFADIATSLLQAGGARTVSGVEELAIAIADLADNPERAKSFGAAAKKYAASQSGAAKMTAGMILNLLEQQPLVCRDVQGEAA